jgi:hypothetical protein
MLVHTSMVKNENTSQLTKPSAKAIFVTERLMPAIPLTTVGRSIPRNERSGRSG